jgi:hypothetical protein
VTSLSENVRGVAVYKQKTQKERGVEAGAEIGI